MTLQTSGAISLADVNVELGFASTAQLGLADTVVRTLFGVSSGAISMTSGYGKNNTRTLVSGSLSGSGSLSIPSGVTTVYLNGQGGAGWSDYNPGQPYVAPTAGQDYIAPWWDNPGTTASAATYKWGTPVGSWIWTDENESAINFFYTYYGSTAPTGACALGASKLVATSAPAWEPNWVGGISPHWWFNYTLYQAVVDQPEVAYVAPSGAYHPGQPYIAPDPGQSYVAPSGGDYYGSVTTATLNGATQTWSGGYGATAGAASGVDMISTGAGQSLAYSVSGSLSYSYYLP